MFECMRAYHLLPMLILSIGLRAQEGSLIGQAAVTSSVVSTATAGGKTKLIAIKVMDMKSKQPVPFFTIDFSSCGHPIYESDDAGLFSMETIEGFSCYVQIAKSGYTKLDMLLDYEQIPGRDKTYNIYLSRSPNYYTGHIKDASSQSLYLDKARVELLSVADRQVQRMETNRQGQFALYILPNTKYLISVVRQDYKEYEKPFETGAEVDPYFIKNIMLTPLVTKLRRPGFRSGLSVGKKETLYEQRRKKSAYFSIQVLAKHMGQIDLEKYRLEFGKYGRVFIENAGKLDKLKVGKFFDRGVAEKVMVKIKQMPGYSHAFLTQHLPLQIAANGVDFVGPRYMVRLASYLNPELFDASKVSVLGDIKALEKNEWTIMLLEGFGDLDDAKSAAFQAQDLGFRAAHVVIWDDEKLKRIR